MAIVTQAKIEVGKLLIGGEWRDAADGRTMPVVNPATEEPLAEGTTVVVVAIDGFRLVVKKQ